MDFMQRGNRPTQPAASTATHSNASSNTGGKNDKTQGMRLLRYSSVALLFSIAILLIALAAFMAFGGGDDKGEEKFVDTSKLQAVFLNGGQVYFGRVSTLNSKLVRMNDIYYLRVNQQVQPNSQTTNNDVSLVKLGCELHGPKDEMVINREQVVFWENLKDDGQVAKAVAQYKQQNPNGQKCETTSDSSSNSNNTTNNSTNTNTNNTTTKKP